MTNAAAKNSLARLLRALGAASLLLTVGSPTAQASTSVFGSSEKFSARLAAFPKWTQMMLRNTDPTREGEVSCRNRLPGSCRERTDWDRFVAGLASQSRARQIEIINDEVNRSPYITDSENWGLRDYWAAVVEFLRRDGDCEDYAITKYDALKALGFPKSAMRIVVVQDENLNTAHAVLSLTFEGRTLILDNQAVSVLPDSAIYHYRPVFSINESGWWLHTKP
jgi:predicted transglutaminase-like cysteine proteinase